MRGRCWVRASGSRGRECCFGARRCRSSRGGRGPNLRLRRVGGPRGRAPGRLLFLCVSFRKIFFKYFWDGGDGYRDVGGALPEGKPCRCCCRLWLGWLDRRGEERPGLHLRLQWRAGVLLHSKTQSSWLLVFLLLILLKERKKSRKQDASSRKGHPPFYVTFRVADGSRGLIGSAGCSWYMTSSKCDDRLSLAARTSTEPGLTPLRK